MSSSPLTTMHLFLIFSFHRSWFVRGGGANTCDPSYSECFTHTTWISVNYLGEISLKTSWRFVQPRSRAKKEVITRPALDSVTAQSPQLESAAPACCFSMAPQKLCQRVMVLGSRFYCVCRFADSDFFGSSFSCGDFIASQVDACARAGTWSLLICPAVATEIFAFSPLATN